MKILAQRPTHIYAVATVLLITKTFTVKYYDIRIQTNTVSRRRRRKRTMTHIKRDIRGNLQSERGKGRDKIKLKKTTTSLITTKKRNRILNKIKRKQNTTTTTIM